MVVALPTMVDEAVERNPAIPSTDVVALPHAWEVNGKTVNPASFVSCDVLIVDVANEYTFPLDPTPTNPDPSDERISVPIFATVDDEYENEARVVDVLENV